MTARREVPITGDSLGWVHNEVADLKSKMALTQQAAEQSRLLAMEAASAAESVKGQMEGLRTDEGLQRQIQDAIITLHERMTRVEDDIQFLRHSRDEADRKTLLETEKQRQERNEMTKAVGELDRKLEILLERLGNEEEQGRRNVEAGAHMARRIEALEAAAPDEENWRSRTSTTLGRMDQDLTRITSSLGQVAQDVSEQRERTSTAMENLRRVAAQVEGAHSFLNRIHEIDERLELVQAERTRHNERINELDRTLSEVATEQNQQKERASLIDTRMASYQDDVGRLREEMRGTWDRLAMHLRGLTDLAAALRKRQIDALEKEIRDIRGQRFSPGEE